MNPYIFYRVTVIGGETESETFAEKSAAMERAEYFRRNLLGIVVVEKVSSEVIFWEI